jgi:hypothetical protein
VVEGTEIDDGSHFIMHYEYVLELSCEGRSFVAVL